jgi:hypothetical protein
MGRSAQQPPVRSRLATTASFAGVEQAFANYLAFIQLTSIRLWLRHALASSDRIADGVSVSYPVGRPWSKDHQNEPWVKWAFTITMIHRGGILAAGLGSYGLCPRVGRPEHNTSRLRDDPEQGHHVTVRFGGTVVRRSSFRRRCAMAMKLLRHRRLLEADR